MENDSNPRTNAIDFGYDKDFHEHYTIETFLSPGESSSFVYFVASNKTNGDRVAVKILDKSEMALPEDVKREVQILKALSVSGHENIVQFHNALEDEKHVYLVMELCEGGELLDRLLSKKSSQYYEEDAVVVVKQMLKAAEECHREGIVHRDMKPENFLFKSTELDSPLKMIEFGSSNFIKPGQRFDNIVGTSYYVAPEVLKRKSGPESDLWSIGVTTYILLCGRRPFWDKTEDGTYKEVLRNKRDFRRKPWSTISENAKDFVKTLLVKDPNERLSVAQALAHVWVKETGNGTDHFQEETSATD